MRPQSVNILDAYKSMKKEFNIPLKKTCSTQQLKRVSTEVIWHQPDNQNYKTKVVYHPRQKSSNIYNQKQRTNEQKSAHAENFTQDSSKKKILNFHRASSRNQKLDESNQSSQYLKQNTQQNQRQLQKNENYQLFQDIINTRNSKNQKVQEEIKEFEYSDNNIVKKYQKQNSKKYLKYIDVKKQPPNKRAQTSRQTQINQFTLESKNSMFMDEKWVERTCYEKRINKKDLILYLQEHYKNLLGQQKPNKIQDWIVQEYNRLGAIDGQKKKQKKEIRGQRVIIKDKTERTPFINNDHLKLRNLLKYD